MVFFFFFFKNCLIQKEFSLTNFQVFFWNIIRVICTLGKGRGISLADHVWNGIADSCAQTFRFHFLKFWERSIINLRLISFLLEEENWGGGNKDKVVSPEQLEHGADSWHQNSRLVPLSSSLLFQNER